MSKNIVIYLLATIAYWTGTLINPLIVAIFVSIVSTLQLIGIINDRRAFKRMQREYAAAKLYELFRSREN